MSMNSRVWKSSAQQIKAAEENCVRVLGNSYKSFMVNRYRKFLVAVFYQVGASIR